MSKIYQPSDVKIVSLPDKILRTKSKDVELPLSEENIELANRMIYHIEDSQKPFSTFRAGVGVAAIQYGIQKNVFYVKLTQDDNSVVFDDVLFNPIVTFKGKILTALAHGEGCLSVPDEIPNQEGLVSRSYEIKVQAYSYRKQKHLEFHLKGYLAIVFQHELDHLNGKLFIDRINKKKSLKKNQQKNIILI